MQRKEWLVRSSDERAADLAKSLKISPLMAQVLINRGITDAEAGSVFLRPKLTELIGPEQMPGVAKAVGRIKQALEDNEKITVYGDYDVDGITGVSILWQLLRLLGANVDYYVPHRVDEGYGLNEEAVESLGKGGTNLLVTVDCGITALNSAALAKRLDIELIVTDHHQQGSQLPEAAAIVHPAMDETYPNQSSSGAMVAFKLAWALANEFSKGGKLEPELRDFMLSATSLAAMGTVADVMDLRGENRVLTSYGLKALPSCRLDGIRALIESAGLTGQGLQSCDVGFRLGPMLNAAGRMGHARLAVELLTSDNEIRSMHIAEYLKEQNVRRQQAERKIFKRACEMVIERGLNHPERRSIVLAGENWHGGVIGIVASRIVDKFYRPTILIGIPAGNHGADSPLTDTNKCIAQGSGRSIEGFDILNGLKACSEHLKNFGGHKMAAGVKIETDRIPAFAEAFEGYARENLGERDVVKKLYIDAELGLDVISKAVVTELQMLGPFGQGNEEPVLATKGVRLLSAPRRVGARGDHLQVAITDNTASMRCIGFGMGRLEKKLLEREFFNVAYRPQLNTYNGSTNVELVLVDVQFE